MATVPDYAVQQLLDEWPVAMLATINPDGSPHQVPIVFARVEHALWSAVDGKPKNHVALKRVSNLRHDPRFSLLLESYADDWSRLWWVRVSGLAEVITDEATASDDARGGAEALREKYPQYEDTALFAGAPTLLKFVPDKTTSWCADTNRWKTSG